MTRYLKAIFGALSAGASVMLAALEGNAPVVAEDWVKAFIAFLGTFSVVWAVPNSSAT